MQTTKKMDLGYSPGTLPYEPQYWHDLNACADKITLFLKSLNAQDIGAGLVTFDEVKFTLLPRSEYSSNFIIQWVSTIRDPNATFEGMKRAFKALNQTIQFIYSQQLKFAPKNGEKCPYQFAALQKKLVEANQVIKQVSQKGLQQLDENYKKRSEAEKGAYLVSKGEKRLPFLP